jgi:type I restriction enzyme S subunit
MAENETRSEWTLPAGWMWARLNVVCNKVQDGTHFSPQVQYDNPADQRYLYITAKNIKENGVDLSDVTYVDQQFHDSIYRRCNPEKDDVLLIKDGVKTGVATINQLEEEFSLLSSVALLKPIRGTLDPHYLKHYLNSPFGFQMITGQMTGTAIKRIILRRVRTSRIPLAPLQEQRRIVAEIEKHLSRLDAAFAALERARANLARYRASVLQAACEGRLVPTEAELAREQGRDYEPADELLKRILAERRARWEEERWAYEIERAKKKAAQAERKAAGLPHYIRDLEPDHWQHRTPEEYEPYLPKSDKWKQKYDEPEPPDTESLPELPEGWVWVTIKQLGNLISGQHILKKDYNEASIGVSYLTGPADFGQKYPAVSKWTEQPKAIANHNDVLITVKGAGVGKANILHIKEAAISRQLMAIQPFFASSDYLFYFIDSSFHQFQRLGAGSTVPGIDRDAISGFVVPLPPLAEQRRIVEEVERRVSVIHALEQAVEANLTRAQRLRQSILKKAFEGRLVDQDPGDEPASALLARIKAQREA